MKTWVAFAAVLFSGLALSAAGQSTAAARCGQMLSATDVPAKIAIVAFQEVVTAPTNFSATSPTCRRSMNRSATS